MFGYFYEGVSWTGKRRVRLTSLLYKNKTTFCGNMKSGDMVELVHLASRIDLNGQFGTIQGFWESNERWMVKLPSSKVVTIQRENIRFDVIEIVREDSDKSICFPKPLWSDSRDADKSAMHLLEKLLKATHNRFFHGWIFICFDGKSKKRFKPPSVVVRLNPKSSLWDEDSLMLAASSRLGRRCRVEKKPMNWSLDEKRFCFEIGNLVRAAHATKDLVQIVFRTDENVERFGLLAVLVNSSESSLKTALGIGTTFCEPPDAIAFCLDDMCKLPACLTVEQAARKVEQLFEGHHLQACPICMESVEIDAVYMPCQCNVNIHLACLNSMHMNDVRNCPSCRGVLDWSRF